MAKSSTTQSIDALMNEIEKDVYFLPEFQRGYVWTTDKIKKYFQSLYEGYPTGTFLIWKTPNPSKMRGDVQAGAKNDKLLILDGQQRLTTLYAFLKGRLPFWFEGKDIRTDLYFNLEAEDTEDEFQYYAKTRMEGKREWINVPIFLQRRFTQYIDLYGGENKDYLFSKFEKLKRLDSIHEYTYHIEEIDEQDTVKVVDIFNLVNSQGTPLSKSDLALALVTSRWEACKDLMRKASDKYKQIGFDFDMDFFMRCLAVVATERGLFVDVKDLSQEDIIATWQKIEKAVDYLVNIAIHHAYIDHTKFLNSLYPFFPAVYYLSKNDFKFPDEPTRDKFLYWFYNSLIWGRYSGSSETMLDQDIRVLKETNSVDELIKTLALSRGGNLTVTAEDLELQGMQSRFYQMVYILIRSNGATDWADPSLPLYHKSIGKTFSVEKHHIFPKSKLYKIFDSRHSYEKRLVNEIANMAFLTSQTNHSIFNNDPERYLANIDSEQLRQQYIPTDSILWKMSREGYEAFLTERRKLLADGVNNFLHKLFHGKSSIHVVKDDEQWRQRVEEIEVALRELIVAVYSENEEDISWAYIPPHILPKIKGRIEKHLKDNPGEPSENFMSLKKQVQFFDVSEYCDLITSKDNWPYFEHKFGHKPTLQHRFSQLQNLRNALAHNREFNDVVVKDAEASILWFSAALRKQA